MRGNQRDRYDNRNQSYSGGGPNWSSGRQGDWQDRDDERTYGNNKGGTYHRGGQDSGRRGRSRSRSRSRDRGRERNDNGSERHAHIQNNEYRDNQNPYHRSDNSRHNDHYNEGHASSRHRERDWDRERDRGRDRRSFTSEPTNTIIIKGLPPHTTEPSLYAALANYAPQNIRLITQRGSAECKGYAFVEFFSVEYAEYFAKSFAGSMGDDKAPQLIVENRAVIIDYATPRSDHPSSSVEIARRGIGGGGGEASAKSDWLCDTCGCQNFARRDKCYRCSASKTANAVNVTANLTADPFADISIVSATPCSTLAVRGLPLFADESQVTEMFRQYALVKSAFILRDIKSNMSRGIALVEFFSVEHATHTMNSFNQSQLSSSASGNSIKINYAKESFVRGLPSLLQQQQLFQPTSMHHSNAVSHSSQSMTGSDVHNSYARAALDAAQWSSTGTSNVGVNVQAPAAHLPKEPSVGTPLYFETHGASYVFQPKTGIFYDSLTKFFYCPKSKLYYSEVDGRYVYAVSSQANTTPAGIDFVEFIPPDPSTKLPEEDSAQSTTETSMDLTTKRKPITMSLGGVSSKRGGAKGDKSRGLAAATITNVASILPSAAKEISSNIAKWSDRRNDTGSDDNDDQTLKSNLKNPSSIATRSDTNSIKKGIAPQQTMEPVVCTLCRRQFGSKEQLQRHERESKLHATNLVKAGLARSTPTLTGSSIDDTPTGSSTKYRDRASERRAVHGQVGPDDIPVVPSKTDWVCTKCNCENFARRLACFRCSAPISIADGGPVDSLRQRRGSVDLDENNVSNPVPLGVKEDMENPGNALLRRLGWKDGEGLGRGGGGEVESVATIMEQKGAGNSTVKSGVGLHSSTKPPGNDGVSSYAGEGKEYKKSILRAAKARYDRIDKQSDN